MYKYHNQLVPSGIGCHTRQNHCYSIIFIIRHYFVIIRHFFFVIRHYFLLLSIFFVIITNRVSLLGIAFHYEAPIHY